MSPWICSSCERPFKRKGDLTRHQLTHTGIKPHICETCGKGFAQYSGLKTHQNVHTKAKPYICGIGTCKKAFGDPSSCSRHRKETHRREGVYKCIIADCGTRIKRRSAFLAHLRKHGLDPTTLDLGTIVLQNSERGTSAPVCFASPAAVNNINDKAESRSAPASVLGDSSGYRVLGEGGEASYTTNNGAWLGSDDPLNCRRADWSSANDVMLPGSMFHQTVSVGPSGSTHDIYGFSASNPFSCDGVMFTPVDYSLLVSPPNLPTWPFLETGSDGSQSIWSSPSSTYSALYSTGFDDDVTSLSLANDVSQESLLMSFPCV